MQDTASGSRLLESGPDPLPQAASAAQASTSAVYVRALTRGSLVSGVRLAERRRAVEYAGDGSEGGLDGAALVDQTLVVPGRRGKGAVVASPPSRHDAE